MVALGFIIGALVVGLVLYLPIFLWFRLRGRRDSGAVSSDLRLSLHLAFVGARKLRYETVSLEQLLLVLLDNPRVVDVLGVCAIDIEAVRSSVSAIVRDSTPVAAGTGAVDPQASPEFKRVLQRAMVRVQSVARSTGRRRGAAKSSSWISAILRKPAARGAVDGADMLVALLDEPEGRAVEALRHHGLTRSAVVNVLAHGVTSTDPASTPPLRDHGTAEMAVVLENDDFTPMEFVVGMLQEHLGLDQVSAVQVMLEVHHEGRAVCGRFPADVAADKAQRLRAAAREAGHPLRCVVEAR